MSSDKHLVLDPDVHRELIAKKRTSGSSAREIGNTILRSILARPVLSDVVAEKLLASGKITKEEFDSIMREAIEELDAVHRGVAGLLHHTEEGTFVAGSWEGRMLHSSPGGTFQVVESWARDAKQRPMPLHSRDASTDLFLVLSGRVAIILADNQKTLHEREYYQIPPGVAHVTIPMTKDTRTLIITYPADPEMDGLAAGIIASLE